MMQSLNNALRKGFFRALDNPAVIMSLALLLTDVIACILVKNPVLIRLVTLSILLFMLYIFICSLKKRELTDDFYAVKYFGWNYIYQKRKHKSSKTEKKSRNPEHCAELIDYEISNLPGRLPKGRFVAITHDFVIEILKKNNITIKSPLPAYRKDLIKLQNGMFGCNGCDKAEECWIRENGEEIKQFYYIKFNIKREEQSNPIR